MRWCCVMLIGVAAFNLVATLIMVVMEKRKDIAVLMAMGATRRDVRLIFVLKGLIVGAAGTAAGLLLGAVGCFALARYQFIHIPREIYGISTLPIAVAAVELRAGRARLDGAVPAGDDLSGPASLARDAGRGFPVIAAPGVRIGASCA